MLESSSLHLRTERPDVERTDLPIRLLTNALPLGRSDLEALDATRLHCGCGMNLRPGWLNVDRTRLVDPAGTSTPSWALSVVGEDERLYLSCDLTEPLPVESSTFSAVYAEHMIEHMTLEGAVAWLTEMRRVLEPGGLLRVTTPDLRRYVAGYTGEAPEFYAEHREQLALMGVRDVPSRPAWMLNQIFSYWGHAWIYDFEELRSAATAAGFAPGAITEAAYREGRDPLVAELDQALRADETMYVEIVAPGIPAAGD